MLPIAIRRSGYEPSWLDRDFGRLFRRLWGEEASAENLTGSYPVDIDENDGTITVEAELPGFKSDEIEVTVEDNVLTITAERKPEEKKGKKHLAERRFLHVERSFTLPSNVDVDKAEAKLDGGVLKLELPKTAESKPKHVSVK